MMSGTQAKQDNNNREVAKPDIGAFTGHINNAQARLGQVQDQANQHTTAPEPEIDTLEELSATLEELYIANEELRLQHNELLITRLRVEDERQRYHDLFDFAPDGYLVTDAHGNILEINRAALALFNRQHNFLIKKPLSVLIDPQNRQEFRAWQNQASQSYTPSTWEGKLLSKGVRPAVDISLRMVVMRYSSGKPHHLLWQIRDITELKQRNQQLEMLGKRLLEVQETEKRNLSRELHDEVGQLLTGLKMLVASNKTEDALQVLDGLIEQVREMSLELRPAMLDDLGLMPTLNWLFNRYMRQTNINITFNYQGLESRLPAELETAIYRITQESLTNVARYAQTNEVCIQLSTQEKMLHLEIADQGIGFDVEKVENSSTGLRGMKERAAILGGDLVVISAPHEGCHIVARIPIEG